MADTRDMLSAPSLSPRAQAWGRLRRNKAAVAGAVGVCVLMAACFLGGFLWPQDPAAQELSNALSSPSLSHPLGTDALGRDMLARVLQGGRVSFAVGLLGTAVSLVIGVFYGMFSGWRGGRTDALMMRLIDIAYALPFTLFVMLLMVVFGRQFWLIFVAIGAVQWLTMARIVRGETLALKQRSFVEASRVLGQNGRGIFKKHLLPNLAGTIAIYATLTVPTVMLLEAFLSFLGLGVQAPLTSWGDLIKDGAVLMEEAPWLLIFPSLAFSLTLLGLNFLGDGLRDALDPRRGEK